MAELSGLEVLALLKEIDLALRGTYVNNIYTLGTSQLLRLRKAGATDVWLVASPRSGAWVSEGVSERGETSEFTSRLRGELERARYVGASQVDLDRVFVLDFENEARRRLILEMMPPGNLIVVDQEGKVVLAKEEVRTPARRIVRGELYSPPKQSRLSPAEITAEDVKAMWGREKTAGKAIGRNVALPRKYVSESLSRLGLTNDSPSTGLRGREEEVAGTLREVVSEARDNPRPCICRVDGSEEVFVIAPKGSVAVRTAGSVSELCDAVFLKEAGEVEEPPTPTETKRKEFEATISKLKAEAGSLAERAATLRSDAALARGTSIEEALRVLKESGVKPAREPSSASAVASALYDHAKILELRAKESVEAGERLEKKLAKMGPPEARQKTPLSKRKQEWFEKFRWFMTSGGHLAVGGRDAQSNTLLIRRHLSDGDVVYHADLFGSPFFVLKDGRNQSEEEALEVAQATVSFSSGWKTGLGAADAYWVLRDQVSASPESGEYLSKGSFVVRGRKNFVKHALLQVAVGVDQSGRVMAGPESAVSKTCPRYVVLIPHREKQTDTAKRVLKDLSIPGSKGPALDDFVKVLPAGGGKIVRRKTGEIGSG